MALSFEKSTLKIPPFLFGIVTNLLHFLALCLLVYPGTNTRCHLSLVGMENSTPQIITI